MNWFKGQRFQHDTMMADEIFRVHRFVGRLLVVPLRESLALLPLLTAGQWIREYPVRKGFWIIGSAAQAVAIFAMALIAATQDGPAAGWGILA